MSAPQIIKVACPSCAGHVEFPADMRGQIINCPHCGLSMALELPGTPPQPAPRPPAGLPEGFTSKPGTPSLSAEHFNAIIKNEVRREIGGQKQRTSSTAKMVGAVLFVLLVSYMVFLVKSTKTENSGGPAVSISHVNAETMESGGMKITGTIQNLCQVTLSPVAVRFSIFDSQGNKVDTASDYLASLDAGETWSFKAVSFKDNAEKYRLDGIACKEGSLQVKEEK